MWLDQLSFKFSRSSGPGGQNVNKVNTKVDLRFQVLEASWMPMQVREAFYQQNAARINQNGECSISCDTFRTQEANRAECLTRLYRLLQNAARLEDESRPLLKERVASYRVQEKNVNRIEKTYRTMLKKNRQASASFHRQDLWSK